MKKLISAIIPVYRNTNLFLENLQKNKKYLKGCQIIIVNDDPNTNLEDKVQKIAPTAILINNKENLGFGRSVNIGAKIASGKYLMFLNSDVIVKDRSFEQALPLFTKYQDLFAVSFAQTNGKSVSGGNTAEFKNGLLVHKSIAASTIQPNFWAEGGAMLTRKSIFDKLGGFDPLFSPFYWEDIDLSYRAWKSGYTVLFHPQIVVVHKHESTIGRYFEKQEILKIAYRNQFMFHWKNITDFKLCWLHVLHLPKIITQALIKKNSNLIQGFARALPFWPEILQKREQQLKYFSLTDQQVLSKFKNEA